MSLAQANEVLVSATTADLARDAELRFEDGGEHELRGLNHDRQLLAVTEHA